MDERRAVLHSPALWQGEVEVRERVRARDRGFHTRPHKDALVRGLHRAARAWPDPLLGALIGASGAAVQGLAATRGPLREASEAVCRLAAAAGHRHGPGQVARRFVASCLDAVAIGRRLFRDGLAAIQERAVLPPEDEERLRAAYAAHGGLVIAVTHNPGSILSAIAVARHFPLLLVSRNSSSIARTRIALEVYERLGLRVLMVRDGNPLLLARACLRALASGTIVVATLDAVDRGEARVERTVFGQPVPLSPWAARMASHARKPIAPIYVQSTGGRVVVRAGEVRVPTGVEDGMDHYVRHFERWILADPASWSFLADKRWRRVLVRAVGGEAPSPLA